MALVSQEKDKLFNFCKRRTFANFCNTFFKEILKTKYQEVIVWCNVRMKLELYFGSFPENRLQDLLSPQGLNLFNVSLILFRLTIA